jgi:hypothetical protein
VTVTKGAMRKVAGYDCQEYVLALGKSSTTSFHGSREATEVKKGPIADAVFDVAELTRGHKKVPHPLAQTE